MRSTNIATPPTYLFVLPWSLAFLGGVNQVVLNLAEEMIRSGDFIPLVLIPDWDCPSPVWETILGIRTVRWRIRPMPHSPALLPRIQFRLWEIGFQRAFRRFAHENAIAAVNVHYPGPPTFALRRACGKQLPKLPFILSFHGTDLDGIDNEPAGVRAAWQALAARCHAAVACSRDLGAKLRASLGAELVPVIVHNGLNSAAFRQKAGVSAPSAHRVIFNVGKFDEKKGQDVLIAAFNAIANDYPDIRLIMAGAPHIAYDALRAQHAASPYAQRIEFSPGVPHDEVARMFAHASVFVLPSRHEAFGIVLLEAGALGLPVIASAVGGIPEVIDDGVTGLLVQPNDVRALAEALRRVLNNSGESGAMGARLRAHVDQNFSWRIAYAKYRDLVTGSVTPRT